MPIAFALADRLARLREHQSQDPAVEYDPDRQWAAVAIIVAPAPDAILLIRRSERSGDPWSGHMALPGGRRDPNDRELLDTAIRETREEVGIHLGRNDLVGILQPVVPRTRVLPPIAIQPFVFHLQRRPELTLNSEVAAARWVELERLLHPTTHGPVELTVGGAHRVVPAFQLEDGVVWGLTERILASLFEF
ncbi:MAG TPA: CoA pyrophosphatase [Gemmatimonadales bacterium]|nr:CoA pyrophosphatase [Gemmatimonadales bacterium]